MSKFMAILAVLFLSFSAHAQVAPATKDRLLQEVEYIGSLYASSYAPANWKHSHLGWDFSTELSTFRNRVGNASSRWDYRSGLVAFLKSMSDYHVGFAYFSTEKSTLPFSVRTVEGQTIIVYIDRTAASMAAFPFNEGDELLEMDGRPVATLLNELGQELGRNVAGTDAALADLQLTSRSGRKNNPLIPRGLVTLKVKRFATGEIATHQLAWDYTPEKIGDRTASPLALALMQNAPSATLKPPMMFSTVALEAQDTANNFALGAKKSFLGDFGPRIWEAPADNQFDAYIFQNAEGKLIGVIRIPGYIVADYDKASADFLAIIKKFQTQTSGLIIDEVNNPGGSVFYLYNLVSMLNAQAVPAPRHRISLNHGLIMEAYTTLQSLEKITDDAGAKAALGKELGGYPATMPVVLAMRNYCNFLIEQWNAGKSLTEPHYLWGADFINPHPEGRYTKPIVILVNELDFSGGDFFPAIMQDARRANILGTRTSGAGGYVEQLKLPNAFGFELITITGSIAERVDKNPIENLGVVPDVMIPMTAQDYRTGFSLYKAKVLEQLK